MQQKWWITLNQVMNQVLSSNKTVLYEIHIPLTLPKGYSQKNWVGSALTLTLFKIKLCDFLYSFFDTLCKSIPLNEFTVSDLPYQFVT